MIRAPFYCLYYFDFLLKARAIVCTVFIRLHIIKQSGPVVILCHSALILPRGIKGSTPILITVCVFFPAVAKTATKRFNLFARRRIFFSQHQKVSSVFFFFSFAISSRRAQPPPPPDDRLANEPYEYRLDIRGRWVLSSLSAQDTPPYSKPEG